MSHFRSISQVAAKHFSRPIPPGQPPSQTDGYADTVNNLSGGGPLVYWRLGEASGTQMTDSVGTRHGTYSSVTLGIAGLPENSDGAVDFGASGSATVSHDAGLALAAGSVSFWIKPNSLPAENEFAKPYFAKNAVGTNNSDINIYAARTGDGSLKFRHGADIDLDTDAGVLVVDEITHICYRFDNTGFDAYVNGVYQGKNTNYTGGWSANTADITICTSDTFSGMGDAVVDEIAIFNRVITEAEVLALAQQTSVPVAANDTATVPESETTAIDVLANDTYVGSPTLAIVSQPAGGDSVVVSGTLINYTAGSVESDTARSFTYTVTDGNGTSNTATVNVTVQNAAAAASNVNCFPSSGTSSVVVSTMDDLVTQVNSASAGTHILIASGTYTGGTRTFTSSNGTEANPIVIRPQSGRGTVTINTANWTLSAASKRLVFTNLFFNNPSITVNGNNNRFSRCRFRQINRYCFDIEQAVNTRIDHCDFSDYQNNTNGKGCVVFDTTSLGNGNLQNFLFDYNYIHDINHTTSGTAINDIRATSSLATVSTDAGIIIDHCLWENNTNANHGEFIIVKYSGATVRFCTFNNIDGYLQQRQGGGWEVRSCWFENMANSAPLKCWDDYEAGEVSETGRQLIIGNRVVGGDIWIGAGTEGGTTLYTTGGPIYHRSRLGRFIGNIASQIIVGEMWSSQTVVFDALNNNLWNNTGTIVFADHTGTSFNQDNEDFTAAVKLTATNVGMAAADPLCISGPQS